jgi:hypothetical protein
MYWSNGADNPDAGDTQRGAYCYVDSGKRRRAGEFPKGDDVFFADHGTGQCDSGAGRIPGM